MKMISTLCCSRLLVAAISAQRPSQEAPALIGTWRVVEFADPDKDGRWQYWYGEHPRGYFVYDATDPVILLQGSESHGDRFIENLRSDLCGMLNLPKILYRYCALSKDHVQKRSIFAFCSPLKPDRDHFSGLVPP
jgi:hypothetical protein